MGNCCQKTTQFDTEQNYDKLKDQCRKSGEKFVDPKFPCNSSILPSDTNQVEWLRPEEICQMNGKDEHPELFDGTIDMFDVNQGELGDCWFASALSMIADKDHFIKKVIPSGQRFDRNYWGIFRFRFYRFGEWIEIVIDDRLPTRYGKLIFLRSNKTNEFWPALVEKAYAKFYGSYAGLIGGVGNDAAVDFTGGIPQIIKRESQRQETGDDSEKLFQTLKVASANGAFIGTSPRQTNIGQLGLNSNHLYTITKVVDPFFKKDDRKISLRNPWGLRSNENEGYWSQKDFLYSDFQKFFGDIEIVHLNVVRMLTNSSRKARKFHKISVHGKWERGSTAGGTSNWADNPQYRFKVTKLRGSYPTCSIIVSLSQKLPQRSSKAYISFRIYKVSEEFLTADRLPSRYIDNAFNLVEGGSGTFYPSREVTLSCDLTEGDYCIVPSTYQSNVDREFLLRIWTNSRWKCQLQGGKVETETDYKCCFVCCYYGGSVCACCSYCCTMCRGCCSNCSSCCEKEDDFYQKSSSNDTTQMKTTRFIKVHAEK